MTLSPASVLLAATSLEELLPAKPIAGGDGGILKDLSVAILVPLAVTLVGMAWIYFAWKRAGNKRGLRTGNSGDHSPKRRRRRLRRNPTVAESGGLPPPRTRS